MSTEIDQGLGAAVVNQLPDSKCRIVNMIRMPRHRGLHLKERRKRHISLSQLQKKHYAYAKFFTKVAILFGGSLTAFCIYLLNNNYSLFEDAFLVYAPEAVKGLSSELHFANLMLIGSLISYVVLMTLLGLRISHKLIVPIYLIQEKMIAMAQGQTALQKLAIRKSDDLQEYCESFNHMTETLKTKLAEDIQMIEMLKPDPKNYDAFHIWEKLLQGKKNQLGDEPIQNQNKKSA